jgi:hypothetical protein
MPGIEMEFRIVDITRSVTANALCFENEYQPDIRDTPDSPGRPEFSWWIEDQRTPMQVQNHQLLMIQK